VFNNSIDLAIEQSDPTVATYYTQGATGSISPPTVNSPTPTLFTAIDVGQPPGQVPQSVASPLPDLTIDVVSQARGRPSSATVSARIQFVTANPSILGDNSASVLLTDITTNALIYYTLDGNPPTNGAPDTFGPVYSSNTISFVITSNTTLSVQATALNFAPSGVVT